MNKHPIFTNTCNLKSDFYWTYSIHPYRMNLKCCFTFQIHIIFGGNVLNGFIIGQLSLEKFSQGFQMAH